MTRVALEVDLVVQRGDVTVTAAFTVAPGERISLLGPNGAGKSTLLGAIGGLIAPMAADVRLGDRMLEGPGIRLRPDQRHITVLDQKPRLFPHLTVAQNIAFGPRARGANKNDARREARRWLGRVELADRAEDRPHTLSGGQQQRVAIARAFAAAPQVMLLDEPFAALDAASVPAIRALVTEELDTTATTSILVTHDLADAWQWSSRCIVIDKGEVVVDAAPRDIAERPSHPFTAALAGFGVLRGIWDGVGVLADGLPVAAHTDVPIVAGRRVFAVAAPRHVRVVAPHTPGAVPGTVEDVALHAGIARLRHSTGLIAELDAGITRLPAQGDVVWVAPAALRAFTDAGVRTSE